MAQPAWDPRQIYRLNEQVTLSTSTWVCTRDFNFNNAPSNSSEWWGAVAGPAAGVTTITSVTSGMPVPPLANASSTTTITLVPQANLTPGGLYWVSFSPNLVTFNLNNTFQSVQFVDSVDTFAAILTCDTTNFSASNNRLTIPAIKDRPGQAGGNDQYPAFLTLQLTSAPITSDLTVVISLQNKSGTCSWGTASTMETTVYKV